LFISQNHIFCVVCIAGKGVYALIIDKLLEL